jgi:hypothetical protein
MMRLIAISLLMLLLSSCATRQVQTLANLPLPADQSANCCWQALQKLDITYGKQQFQLTGVLAQTRNGVTLVLLDPFGRRLLSITKQGEAINTYRSPELPAELPEHFLLASSMLVWWPLADWQALLSSHNTGASPNTGWKLEATTNSRVLSYRGQAIIRAGYGTTPISISSGMTARTVANQEIILLQHQRQPMAITITTQSWEPL